MNQKKYNYSKAICGYMGAALDLLKYDSPPSDYAQALVFWANFKRVKQPWTNRMQSLYSAFKDRIDALLNPVILKGCLVHVNTSELGAELRTICKDPLSNMDSAELVILCENWIQDRDELNILLKEIESRLPQPGLPPDYYRLCQTLETIDLSALSHLESFLPAAPMIKNLRAVYEPASLQEWWWRLSQRKLKPQNRWLEIVKGYFQIYPDYLIASTDEPVQLMDIPIEGIWKFWSVKGLELSLIPFRGQICISVIGDRLNAFQLKSLWINKELTARSDISRIQTNNMILFPLGRFEDKSLLTIWFELNRRDYSLDLEISEP